MEEKNKRRRAVALALIAFFCTAAATYVAADWKRFSGGVLAFFKGSRQDQANALAAAAASTRVASAHSDEAPAPINHDGPPQLAAAPVPHARHAAGGGGKKATDDLFVYGDPAAGKPGSFLVASNDTSPAPGTATVGDVPLPGTGTPSPSASPASGDPGFSAPNPGSAGGSGDNGLTASTPGAPTPTPSSPTASTPTTTTPTQSGSTDTNPVPPVAPVSSVPEASSAAMMTLAALFVAAAAQAQRRRRQEEENA